ncbi:MAG: hypothetical protein GX874_00115 [Smithella sp.]|nr:hypothetical protein [Smithella sp.]
MKEWPVCLTCSVVSVREVLRLPDGEQKTTGINKKAPVVAFSMKITTVFINRTLLDELMLTISGNSQERF